MKIIFTYFNYKKNSDPSREAEEYLKMAQVLEYSLKKNSPLTPYVMSGIPAPKLIAEKRCFDSNNHKFHEWVRQMDAANDDVILMDADMLVLGDLSTAFDDDFDIGITKLPAGDKLPYNGGVVFVRNNEKARAFIHKWEEVDQRMYCGDKELHRIYRSRYAGMNQASLGYVIERCAKDLKIKWFDCREWNSCRDLWQINPNKCKILHIKSRTRTTIFLPTPIAHIEQYLRSAIILWRKYAHESGVQKFPEYALKLIDVNRKGVGGYVTEVAR